MNTYFLSYKNYPLNRKLIHGACVKQDVEMQAKKRMGNYSNCMLNSELITSTTFSMIAIKLRDFWTVG